MRKDRLLKLADFLETQVKPEWFDLAHWAQAGWTDQKCGTTACAMGWATVCFKGEGLELVQHLFGAPEMQLRYTEPATGDTYRSITAVEKFMDLDEDDVSYLFVSEEAYALPMDEITPVMVAEKIREFVARNDVNP